MEKLQNPSLPVALGALFHDVGKPATYAERGGKITFYNHAHLGAQMTQRLMRRLRFSNQEIRAVSECVEQHMKFGDVQRMRSGKLKQFMARPTFMDELEVHRIDCQSSHGNMENYEFLRRKLKEFEAEEMKPKPLVNGHDLVRLGMKPGPGMKQLLEELYEMQLEKHFDGREGGLQAAEKLVRGLKAAETPD